MKTALRIVSKGYFNSIQQFHMEKEIPLGVGSFGTVRLGTHIKTTKLYAIKIVDISDGMSENELKILQRQILLHSALDHPHIIKLWDTIRQNSKIYMILEYASNGSLFHYQNRYTRFPENEGYKYFYQTMEGLRYLHSQNIMHRDIKPENLLLDNEGNIKICDFGWATENIHQKRSTFCGTYEYMAPQMAYQKQYDYRIDIWALGVLIFQLTHGYAPFRAKSLEDIKQKLSKGSYEISNSCSKQLKHLIMSILQFEPQDRPTIQQICSHEWTQTIPRIILSSILSEQQNRKKQKTQKSNAGSNKKLARQLSGEEVVMAKANNYVISNQNTSPQQSKHKKYQSTDFQSHLSNNFKSHFYTASSHGVTQSINGGDSSAKLNFNRNIKKPNEDISNLNKRLIKKKCKTQGQQYLERNIQLQIESGKFNQTEKFGNYLQAQNINLLSASGSSIKRLNSGSNFSTQMANNQIFHPHSANKENNVNTHANPGSYTMNKVQTLCSQSFRNSNGFDEINYGAIITNLSHSHDKNHLNNQSVGNSNTSKMKKLENKISQLTNKYVTDKRRLKSKNIKQYA